MSCEINTISDIIKQSFARIMLLYNSCISGQCILLHKGEFVQLLISLVLIVMQFLYQLCRRCLMQTISSKDVPHHLAHNKTVI